MILGGDGGRLGCYGYGQRVCLGVRMEEEWQSHPFISALQSCCGVNKCWRVGEQPRSGGGVPISAILQP